MDLSGCFWRVGRRGQVGTESQSNSNHSGDSRPGFRLGVWESWTCYPETSSEWIRELLVPCTMGNTTAVGNLRDSAQHCTAPKGTDAQQRAQPSHKLPSAMRVLPGQEQTLTANSSVPCHTSVSCAVQVQVTPPSEARHSGSWDGHFLRVCTGRSNK